MVSPCSEFSESCKSNASGESIESGEFSESVEFHESDKSSEFSESGESIVSWLCPMCLCMVHLLGDSILVPVLNTFECV